MQQVQGDLHVSADGPLGAIGGAAPGEDGDADAFFRADAERLGYEVSRPGQMAKYYRTHGILPPRYLEEGHAVEVTGLELDRLDPR